MEQLTEITRFFLDSFIRMWPYILISIPLAVVVKISGASRLINKALSKKPIISILLATIVGAFSPFCSCSVIPVISSLLIGGVPLAPVMSFWIASPSMDPEIFFLSTATVGLKLSVWRLAATFVISLSAGIITHFAILKGFIGKDVLRENQVSSAFKPVKFLKSKIIDGVGHIFSAIRTFVKVKVQLRLVSDSGKQPVVNCCISIEDSVYENSQKSCITCTSNEIPPVTFGKRIINETWNASFMILKFMALAILINALITFYVPQDFISNLLGGEGVLSVLIATMVGIPAYTSNLTALPFISGLISLGMNQGAALAFLIAGPTTTIAAMIAVWGITKRRIFFLYISFSLLGALLFGVLFNLFN
jgi:uncharacterized membrane protein YraQ (UPF0718 family)